jgi:GntR family transcriptional regulator, rspAB operon transcriptional repressor
MTVMEQLLSRTRLDRSQPMREQIYTLIRGLILNGKIPPGEIIDEKEIAARLNVSRTPVREAVKKLSDEHLVDVIAQSATRATRIDKHEVEQAFIIRRALEMECAARAASVVTDAHIEELGEALQRHERAIARKDYEQAIAFDDRFHRLIAQISDLPRLWRAIEISKGQLDRCRFMMLPRAGEAEATLTQHAEIIRALKARSPDHARLAMSAHLERSYFNAARALEAEATTKKNAAT